MFPTPTPHASAPRPLSACIIGLGNIGSQLVPLLVRGGRFGSLTLVDPDVFEVANVRTQNVRPTDVGRPKAEALAAMARSLDPSLGVVAHHAAVEDVPLGRLRADVLFSGPDTRLARQHVNRIAWRLGVRAWIDTGIEPAAQLVRVSLFAPRDGEPCMECGWGPDDYAAIGEHRSCLDPAVGAVASTNGPPALGALAAARAALLCDEVLDSVAPRAGFQITLAVREHRLAVTTFRRSPQCRFDHGTLPLDRTAQLPVTAALRDLEAPAASAEARPSWTLHLDGCEFATRLVCIDCGQARDGLQMLRPFAGASIRCACGGRYTAPPLSMNSRLDRARLTAPELDLPLGDIGLLTGDILGLAPACANGAVELVELISGAESGDHTRESMVALSSDIR